ncbi:MAG: glycosyltransferase family 9 protein [Chlorobiaceae bacterium]|nr:glycosyltransferase family 9 protein [Chlorobiaceae bacterium]
MNARVEKILMVRLSSIGDIVLTTPVLREVAVFFPDAVIDYCTKPAFRSLLDGNPHIRALHTIDDPPSERYDLVIDLQNNIRSARLIRSIDHERVVKYRKSTWKKLLLARTGMDITGPYRSVVDRYRGSLDGFGVKADGKGCELFPSDADRIFAESATGAGVPLLAVCPGAKHFTKRYPAEKFASILALLFRAMPLKVVILGGKEDSDTAAGIMAALPPEFRPYVADLAGKTTFLQSAAVLGRSDAVLTNDTGLMHIASAFGKKIFLLFGSSVPAFGFLPYRVPFELFEVRGLRCRPCSHIGRSSCRKGHFRCMNDLKEGWIAASILKYFNRREP